MTARKFLLLICAWSVPVSMPSAADALPGDASLPAGAVFREHVIIASGDNGWRVTDPDVRWDSADEFLPNPVFPIENLQLENAIRAELVVDYWSGHIGTRDKTIRFNRGSWLPVPDAIVGSENPAHEVSQTNLHIPVPIEHLREGANTLQGSCGNNDWDWGQWGWYAAVLRIFYDPAVVPPAAVTVRTPDSSPRLNEKPVFGLEGDTSTLREVRFLARYHGVDEDGDGVYQDFHGMFRKEGFEGHLGTATSAPWEQTWDTTWVPDQEPGSIAIQALVLDKRGLWTATSPVDGLTLVRPDHSVSLHTTTLAHRPLWVRASSIASAIIRIPPELPLDTVSEARLYLRTWNGLNHETGHIPIRINSNPWLTHISGRDHYFHSGLHEIRADQLQSGDNLISFTAESTHHGPEILWPGPQILLRHSKALPAQPAKKT